MCIRDRLFPLIIVIIIIIYHIISSVGGGSSRYYVDIFPQWASEWGKAPNVGTSVSSGSIIVYASVVRSCFVLRNGRLRRESTRCLSCVTLCIPTLTILVRWDPVVAKKNVLYAFTDYCHHSFRVCISNQSRKVKRLIGCNYVYYWIVYVYYISIVICVVSVCVFSLRCNSHTYILIHICALHTHIPSSRHLIHIRVRYFML